MIRHSTVTSPHARNWSRYPSLALEGQNILPKSGRKVGKRRLQLQLGVSCVVCILGQDCLEFAHVVLSVMLAGEIESSELDEF